MFVSRKVVFRKSFSKLSCVCLPLGKLFNEKHFLVNRKHFPVNGNTFRSIKNTFQSKKIWFGFQKSVFPFGYICFSESGFRKTTFQTFCVCLPLEKLVNEKHFPVKEKIGLVFRKVFSWKIWAENTFRKLWKI